MTAAGSGSAAPPRPVAGGLRAALRRARPRPCGSGGAPAAGGAARSGRGAGGERSGAAAAGPRFTPAAAEPRSPPPRSAARGLPGGSRAAAPDVTASPAASDSTAQTLSFLFGSLHFPGHSPSHSPSKGERPGASERSLKEKDKRDLSLPEPVLRGQAARPGGCTPGTANSYARYLSQVFSCPAPARTRVEGWFASHTSGHRSGQWS